MKHAYFLLRTELQDDTNIADVVKYVEEDVEMECIDYMNVTANDDTNPYIAY